MNQTSLRLQQFRKGQKCLFLSTQTSLRLQQSRKGQKQLFLSTRYTTAKTRRIRVDLPARPCVTSCSDRLCCCTICCGSVCRRLVVASIRVEGASCRVQCASSCSSIGSFRRYGQCVVLSITLLTVSVQRCTIHYCIPSGAVPSGSARRFTTASHVYVSLSAARALLSEGLQRTTFGSRCGAL
jgi:hypothetical protein